MTTATSDDSGAGDDSRETETLDAGSGPADRGGIADEIQILGTRDLAMVRAMWRFLAPYKGLFLLSVALLPLIDSWRYELMRAMRSRIRR